LADDAMEHSLDALFKVWICTLATAYLMEKVLAAIAMPFFLTRVLTTLAHLYNLLKMPVLLHARFGVLPIVVVRSLPDNA
jgi:hypothetical protein